MRAEGCHEHQIQRTEKSKVKKEVKFNKPKRDNEALSWKDAKPGKSMQIYYRNKGENLDSKENEEEKQKVSYYSQWHAFIGQPGNGL